MIPVSEILAVVTTKAGELLNQEALRKDAEAIVALGWFADVVVRLESEPGGVHVVFLVAENPVVTEVVVEGNAVIPTEEILRALAIPTGQVLNAKQARTGLQAVEALYESRGYILARVVDIALEPVGDGRVRVRIAEGRIEEIVFKGLVKTRVSTARRFILMKPNDVFNVRAMNADLQRLFQTELFETVQARPRPGSTPDAVIIEIEVTEALTARLGFGIGYSTASGLLGQIEFSERNWRGKAQVISLRAEHGLGRGSTGSAARSTFSLSFREPFLDAQRTFLEVNLFQTESTQTEVGRDEITGELVTTSRFDLDRVGSAIEVGRPVDPFTVVSIRLRSELATITPLPLTPIGTCPPDPCDPPTLFSPGRTVSVTFSGTRDRRDSRTSPTTGSRQSLSLEFALPALGGEFNFQKYYAEWVQYVSLGGQSVLAGRVAGGFGAGFIPLQERFTLGGPTSLRGFPSARFRGTSQALMNLEFRTPLGGIASFLKDFTGVIFVDGGQTWGQTEVPSGSDGFKVDYGIGVAFSTPLGVLRVDFAFGPEGNQTWLSVGHPF